MSVDAFFAYARERHATHLRRSASMLREDWTKDPILRAYRFCNIFRELDRTTIWFRENVRDRLRDDPEVLLATVLFRWFNRIETGEAIFLQKGLSSFESEPCTVATAWDLRHGAKAKWFADHLRKTILHYRGDGPYVTGSYIIKTPDGKSKLDGVLWCIEQFLLQDFPVPGDRDGFLGSSEPLSFQWRGAAEAMLGCTRIGQSWSLESTWKWLRQFPYLGDFMAYEIVTDLRHTALLDRAPDTMTWANPGPGAMRGLNRIVGRPLDQRIPKDLANKEMRLLLEKSRDSWHWPQFEDGYWVIQNGEFNDPPVSGDWPTWEMRDVEHTLCEFDKYERARLGQGRPRQVFR